MASSADTYNQMQKVLAQYQNYGTPDSTKISQDLSVAVGNYAPQYQELAGLQRAAYQAPGQTMESLYNQFGGVAGPEAMTRLNQMMNQYNQKQATASSFGDILNQKKAGLNDLANSVLNSATTQKGDLMNMYGQLGNTYSTQKSAEEAAATRAENARIAAEQLKAQQVAQTQAQKQADVANWQTAVSDAKSQRGSMNSATLNYTHDLLLKQAQALGIPADSEAIWVALGNSPAGTVTTQGVSPYYQSISNAAMPKNSLDKWMVNNVGGTAYNAMLGNQKAYQNAPGLTTVLNMMIPGLGSLVGSKIK